MKRRQYTGCFILRSTRQAVSAYVIAVYLMMLPLSMFQAQNIGINTTGAAPSGDAALDVDFSDKGVLIPRVSLTNTGTYGLVGGPSVNSMLVYNTNNSITGTGAFGRGFYYWNSTLNRWVRLADVGTPPDPWYINGNYQTTESNFVGTTDYQFFSFRVNNQRAGRIDYHSSTFLGYQAGTIGFGSFNNTAIGYQALSGNDWWWGQLTTVAGYRSFPSSLGGGQSTGLGAYTFHNFDNFVGLAIGTAAYYSFYTFSGLGGLGVTAIGDSAVFMGQHTNRTIAIGRGSCFSARNHIVRIAIGVNTLRKSSAGGNIAIGREAVFNQTGWDNWGSASGIGTRALYNENRVGITGQGNGSIGIGDSLLFNCTTCFGNVVLGRRALFNMQTSAHNVALGNEAMELVATGFTDRNVAVGWRALRRLNGNSSTQSNENVAVGANAGTSPTPRFINNSVFIGADSYVDANRTNVALFGYGITDAQCTGNNQVLLGNTAVTQIRAQVTGITTYSDARFKQNVAEDVKGLDFILALRPVSYQTDPEVLHRIWGTPDSLVRRIDHSQAKQTRFSGFIAQEVEAAARKAGFAFPGMDVPRNEKEVYSLRYTDFIVPLVKAVQERQQVLDRLAREYEALTGEITELEARVQHQKTANRRYEAEIHAIRNALEQHPLRNPDHQIKSTTQK